jgi:hypothetical protein
MYMWLNKRNSLISQYISHLLGYKIHHNFRRNYLYLKIYNNLSSVKAKGESVLRYQYEVTKIVTISVFLVSMLSYLTEFIKQPFSSSLHISSLFLSQTFNMEDILNFKSASFKKKCVSCNKMENVVT